ncbi:MAG: YkgJ family cysteine cluster protein [Planctomycetota bacterium]|jgi:Fe-S-cluster containining protein|nr:YkgJ family cysteine cluster protein [Planctomycetota bacterium]
MTGYSSLCARCAGLGETCCQNSQVFLTVGDVRRIARAINAASGFFEEVAAADPNYLTGDGIDPVWNRIFDRKGYRRILAFQAEGKCFFLGTNGCRLSLEIRPLVCRLYPYDYNHIAIKGVYGHRCPEPERNSPALILACLSMNREKAESWRQKLYAEIREEFPD